MAASFFIRERLSGDVPAALAHRPRASDVARSDPRGSSCLCISAKSCEMR